MVGRVSGLWALIVEHEADQYAQAPALTLHDTYEDALSALVDAFPGEFGSWDVAVRGDDILTELRSRGVRVWIELAEVPGIGAVRLGVGSYVEVDAGVPVTEGLEGSLCRVVGVQGNLRDIRRVNRATGELEGIAVRFVVGELCPVDALEHVDRVAREARLEVMGASGVLGICRQPRSGQ